MDVFYQLIGLGALAAMALSFYQKGKRQIMVWQMAPIASPTRKINANDVNISTTFFLKIQFTRSVSLPSM